MGEENDKNDFIGNSATFALIVVFLLQTVVEDETRFNLLRMNNVFVLIVFLVLILLNVSFASVKYVALVGICIFWLSFLLPL